MDGLLKPPAAAEADLLEIDLAADQSRGAAGADANGHAAVLPTLPTPAGAHNDATPTPTGQAPPNTNAMPHALGPAVAPPSSAPPPAVPAALPPPLPAAASLPYPFSVPCSPSAPSMARITGGSICLSKLTFVELFPDARDLPPGCTLLLQLGVQVDGRMVEQGLDVELRRAPSHYYFTNAQPSRWHGMDIACW